MNSKIFFVSSAILVSGLAAADLQWTDLEAVNFTVPPGTSYPGDSMMVGYEVRNNGSFPAATGTWYICASTESVYDPVDENNTGSTSFEIICPSIWITDIHKTAGPYIEIHWTSHAAHGQYRIMGALDAGGAYSLHLDDISATPPENSATIGLGPEAHRFYKVEVDSP